MGSTIAGIKAGIGVSTLVAALMSAFYFGLLTSEIGNIPGCATQAGACYSSIVNIYLPYDVALPVFALAAIFSGVYGRVYEYLPGRGQITKAFCVGLLMCIIYLNLYESYLAATQTTFTLLVAFLVSLSVVYSYVLGILYRRFTRLVAFVSDNPKGMKVMVDSSDVTGKAKTYAYRSSHTVEASLKQKDSGSFKEWLSSGGIQVKDPKSSETEIRINGDGMLKVRSKG